MKKHDTQDTLPEDLIGDGLRDDFQRSGSSEMMNGAISKNSIKLQIE